MSEFAVMDSQNFRKAEKNGFLGIASDKLFGTSYGDIQANKDRVIPNGNSS